MIIENQEPGDFSEAISSEIYMAWRLNGGSWQHGAPHPEDELLPGCLQIVFLQNITVYDIEEEGTQDTVNLQVTMKEF